MPNTQSKINRHYVRKSMKILRKLKDYAIVIKVYVCKTGRCFYQAPNSLTTIMIVSFFYAFL